MQTKYSKKIIEKTIISGDEARTYQFKKLSARTTTTEAFKILKQVFPSVGYGIDSIKNQDDIFGPEGFDTLTGMFQLMSENLSEEHFDDLQDKLLTPMIFNGKEVEDWSEHFDDYPEDYIEILSFIGKETFTSFFMGSGILAPWISKLKNLLPNLKEVIEKSSIDLNIESKEVS